MTKRFLLVLALSGCVMAVESEPPPEVVEEVTEAPDKPDGYYEGKPGPDPCGPSGMKGGVMIPTECYWGPPRWLPEERPGEDEVAAPHQQVVYSHAE